MNNDTIGNDGLYEDGQFVISYELLHVLHWLLKYEQEQLAQLITQAFIKGFEEKIKQQDRTAHIQDAHDLQNSIVNFFSFFEYHIAQIANGQHNKKIMNKNIIKALDHIDPKRFDYDTIKSTVLATADKIKPQNKSNAKELFLKELLRQWNPKKIKNENIIAH